MKEAIWLLFLTNGRLNRKGFWLYFGPMIFILLVGSASGTEPIIIESSFLFWTLAIVIAYSQFAVIIKRYHDLGLSGWWSVLWLVPLGNIVVLIHCGLFPGNSTENKYGNYRFMSNA